MNASFVKLQFLKLNTVLNTVAKSRIFVSSDLENMLLLMQPYSHLVSIRQLPLFPQADQNEVAPEQ